MIGRIGNFDDVIFTDESRMALETRRKKCCRRKGEPHKLKPQPKHPVKVHVWGSSQSVMIFTGIMTARKYWLLSCFLLLKKVFLLDTDSSRITAKNTVPASFKITLQRRTSIDGLLLLRAPDLNPTEKTTRFT